MFSLEWLSCRRAAHTREEARDDIPKLQAFFDECKRNNPQFYYKYQLDNNNVVKNVFWSHASQQGNYKSMYSSLLYTLKWLNNTTNAECLTKMAEQYRMSY